MEHNELLELRSKIKSKKPEFIRQEYERRNRVKRNWRKPKGIHSKMRHHRRGKRKLPSPGYGSPAKVKGLHPSGLKPIIVENENQLPQSSGYGIIISSKVGMKKKALIIKKANENRIKVLNIDAEKFMKKIEELHKEKISSEKISPKEEIFSKEEVKKGQDKKEQEHKEKISPKEEIFSKEEEKKEKDKLLIKRI